MVTDGHTGHMRLVGLPMLVPAIRPLVCLLAVPPTGSPAREAAARLKLLDARVEAVVGQPEACCGLALETLADLEADNLTYALGAKAVNRAMRLCATDATQSEQLYARLVERGLVDAASLQIIAGSRLERNALLEAAAATAELLECVERDGRCSAKTAAQCALVLEACRDAGLTDAKAESRWQRLQTAGVIPPPAVTAIAQRTLAVLKPDALRGGHEEAILALISAEGFRVLRSSRRRMSEEEAGAFLQASWGPGAGDSRRRFFREYASFYASGEVLALLLERDDAISHWRAMLGPGDPSVGRVRAPESLRARWGTNKQANACHGADSEAAVAKEAAWFFGPGWADL